MEIKIKPIPLSKRVTVKEGLDTQLSEKARREGVNLPGRNFKPRLGVSGILDTANGTVGVTRKAYQISSGPELGRIKYFEQRREARAVRRQFAEFLEVIPPDELTDHPAR